MAMTRCLTGMDEAVMHAQRKVATACDCWIRPRARSARLPTRPDDRPGRGRDQLAVGHGVSNSDFDILSPSSHFRAQAG